MLWARILADLVVMLHALYVAFVVLGMAAILIGIALGRGWARNFWFRVLHLLAIGVVVAQEFLGPPAPSPRGRMRCGPGRGRRPIRGRSSATGRTG